MGGKAGQGKAPVKVLSVSDHVHENIKLSLREVWELITPEEDQLTDKGKEKNPTLYNTKAPRVLGVIETLCRRDELLVHAADPQFSKKLPQKFETAVKDLAADIKDGPKKKQIAKICKLYSAAFEQVKTCCSRKPPGSIKQIGDLVFYTLLGLLNIPEDELESFYDTLDECDGTKKKQAKADKVLEDASEEAVLAAAAKINAKKAKAEKAKGKKGKKGKAGPAESEESEEDEDSADDSADESADGSEESDNE